MHTAPVGRECGRGCPRRSGHSRSAHRCHARRRKAHRGKRLPLDRGAHLDGGARSNRRRHDNRDPAHGRHRRERTVPRDGQAQPHSGRNLPGHREEARQCAVRTRREIRSRGQHRPADGVHALPRHDQPHPGNLRGPARRYRRQPRASGLRRHRHDRRQWWQSARHGRSGRAPRRSMGR